MNDITKCPGYDCPVKEYCYRYTVEEGGLQSWTSFSFESGGCDMFWLDKTRDYEKDEQVMKILRERDLTQLIEEAQLAEQSVVNR